MDTAGVKVVFSDPLRSDARCGLSDDPVLSLGADRGDSPSVLERVSGVARLSDGSIAVMNDGTGEVRIFGPDGGHLRSMGTRGRGPGEFRTGSFIWVLPGDTLWVGDYRPWRFNVYAASGGFVRTVGVRPRMDGPGAGGVLANGSSVNVDDGRSKQNFRDPEPRHVYAHAADGSRIRRLVTLNGTRYGKWKGAAAALSTLFDPIPRAAAMGTTVAITTAMDPEVIVLDEAFKPRHIVRWSDPARKVTSAHVQAFRDELAERLGGRDSENWSHQVAQDAVSDRRPVADVFPTVSSLRVGRDGRLWVARYRRPGERWEWMVFGPEGDFICRCPQLPVTPYEFGGGLRARYAYGRPGCRACADVRVAAARRGHRSRRGERTLKNRMETRRALAPFALAHGSVARRPVRVRSLLFAGVSLVALSGCADGGQEPVSFFGAGCTLDTGATLCDDCLGFEQVTRLGRDFEGSGYLVDSGTLDDIVRDSLGNYWVGQNDEIKVFDPKGAFLKTVGRRGKGPMEFGRAEPIHTDRLGRVHVLDSDNGRISVIDEELTLVQEKHFPVRTIAQAPLDDGDQYVVQASISDPGHAGMPLHIMDGSEILESFGAWDDLDPQSSDFSASLEFDLRLAIGPDGNIFAARALDYSIAAWSRDGTLLGVLEGRRELNEKDSGLEPPSPDAPPPNFLGAIHVDSDGLLWVSLALLRPDWLQSLVPDPSGDDAFAPAGGDITQIYHGRVDVVDLTTCRRIASRAIDQMTVFLDDRTVVGYEFTEVGAPVLDVWRMKLTR